MPNINIFPDINSLALAAAELFVRLASTSIQTNGIFTVVLSGGSTPVSLYNLIASEPFRERVDWGKTHIFWGDERCVPPDHPDSNFFRAQISLLSKVPVPINNIHRIPAELAPQKAAEEYEDMLLQFFSDLPDDKQREKASFDLVLLGMGDDGHTASLFPGTNVICEKTRWVSAVYVEQLSSWRVTLTAPVIIRSAQVVFLVSGSNKSWTLQKVLYGELQPERYPAQLIHSFNENVLWYVDESAASLL